MYRDEIPLMNAALDPAVERYAARTFENEEDAIQGLWESLRDGFDGSPWEVEDGSGGPSSETFFVLRERRGPPLYDRAAYVWLELQHIGVSHRLDTPDRDRYRVRPTWSADKQRMNLGKISLTRALLYALHGKDPRIPER